MRFQSYCSVVTAKLRTDELLGLTEVRKRLYGDALADLIMELSTAKIHFRLKKLLAKCNSRCYYEQSKIRRCRSFHNTIASKNVPSKSRYK